MKKLLAFALGVFMIGNASAVSIGSGALPSGPDDLKAVPYKGSAGSVGYGEFNSILAVLRGIYNDGIGAVGIGAEADTGYLLDVSGKFKADQADIGVANLTSLCLDSVCETTWPSGSGGWNHTVTQNILPDTDLAYNLGSDTYRFDTLYVNDLEVGNTTITMGGEPVMDRMGGAFNVKTNNEDLHVSLASGTAGKNIDIENSSIGGKILLTTTTDTSSKISLTSPTIELLGAVNQGGDDVILGLTALGGNVGIGAAPEAEYELDVTGDINYTGTLYKDGGELPLGNTYNWQYGEWSDCEASDAEIMKKLDFIERDIASLEIAEDEALSSWGAAERTKITSAKKKFITDANKIVSDMASSYTVTSYEDWDQTTKTATKNTFIAKKKLGVQTRDVLCVDNYGVDVSPVYCAATVGDPTSPGSTRSCAVSGAPAKVYYGWKVGEWSECGDLFSADDTSRKTKKLVAEADIAATKFAAAKTLFSSQASVELSSFTCTLNDTTTRAHRKDCLLKSAYDALDADMADAQVLDTEAEVPNFSSMKTALSLASAKNPAQYKTRKVDCVSNYGVIVSDGFCKRSKKPDTFEACTIPVAGTWQTGPWACPVEGGGHPLRDVFCTWCGRNVCFVGEPDTADDNHCNPATKPDDENTALNCAAGGAVE